MLNLFGKLVAPKIKNVYKAEINVWEQPELDEHWKNGPQEKPPSSAGMMQILIDKVTFHCIVWIPERMFKNLSSTLTAGKIKHFDIYGEKLRLGRG